MKTKRIAEFALSFSLSLSSLFSVSVPKVYAANLETGTTAPHAQIIFAVSLVVPVLAVHALRRNIKI